MDNQKIKDFKRHLANFKRNGYKLVDDLHDLINGLNATDESKKDMHKSMCALFEGIDSIGLLIIEEFDLEEK
jgi:hypothetical protein